jgi:hypothetical protein
VEAVHQQAVEGRSPHDDGDAHWALLLRIPREVDEAFVVAVVRDGGRTTWPVATRKWLAG